MFDPISPPSIGLRAVTFVATFSGYHCQGFGFGNTAVAVATSSDNRKAQRVRL